MEKTAAIVEQLKEHNEDFEFYPTTKEMLRVIWEYMFHSENKDFGTVLDIGCGTCAFMRYINEFNAEFARNEKRKEKEAEKHWKEGCEEYYRAKGHPEMKEYFVIEKSRILIDKLDPSVFVVGTDFYRKLLCQ